MDPLSQTWNLRVISFSIHSQATTKPYFTFSQYLPNTTLGQVYFTTGFDDLNRLPIPYQLHSILQTNPFNSPSKKFWCPLNPSLNPRIKFKSFQMTLKGKKKKKKLASTHHLLKISFEEEDSMWQLLSVFQLTISRGSNWENCCSDLQKKQKRSAEIMETRQEATMLRI